MIQLKAEMRLKNKFLVLFCCWAASKNMNAMIEYGKGKCMWKDAQLTTTRIIKHKQINEF